MTDDFLPSLHGHRALNCHKKNARWSPDTQQDTLDTIYLPVLRVIRPSQELANLFLELPPQRSLAADAPPHELVYAVRLPISLQHPPVMVHGAVLVHHRCDAKVVLHKIDTSR